MVAYKDKEGYAIKKHKRFRSIVQKWVDVNGKRRNKLFIGLKLVFSS